MNSVLLDLSKNVSFKFLAQLLLELLVKEWRDVAVKRNFWGQISIFWEVVYEIWAELKMVRFLSDWLDMESLEYKTSKAG